MENEIKVGDYCRTRKGIIGILKQQFIFGHGVNYPEPQEWVIDINGKQYVTTECDVDFDNIVKHSPNPIDIIEDNDFCKIEFYSPRYKKRGTRIFEVSKIDEYITFENMHCDLFMKNGEWGNHDKELKPVIKEIYTKEMMESISYKVKE